MKKIVILAFISAFFLCLAPAATMAKGNFLDLKNQEGFKNNEVPSALGQTSDPVDVRIMASRIINIALSFLGIIFFILTVYAGFKWMTAAGNEDQVGEAKKLLTRAVIGLIIILASYGISVFVLKNVYEKAGEVKIL